MGLNPVHGRYYISVVRSLSGFTQPIQENEYPLLVAGVLHMELSLKILIYVLYSLVVDSDCTCARVEANIRRARHKSYTHAQTGITYG